MAEASFDVVSKVDRQEVDNAVNQSAKEIAQRYDFKGSKSEISQEKDAIKVLADDDFRLKAIVDILQSKCIKRSFSRRRAIRWIFSRWLAVTLSVVIITYNEEANLGHALESVQGLVREFGGEMVVVDGADRLRGRRYSRPSNSGVER